MVFAGWHGVSSLGHGLVLVSFFFFFLLILESKYKNETAHFIDLETFGIPKFKNRTAYYLYQINKLRHIKKNNILNIQTGARREHTLYILNI